MHVTVRRSKPSDLKTIVGYNAAMARETEGLELDREVLTKGVVAVMREPSRGFYLLAEAAGRVVGQTMITFEWSDWRNGNFWWIQSVYVHPAYRRRGVYRELYRQVGQTMITFEWSDWRNGNFWWIQSVYVHPAYRRRGVYRELYRHVLEGAKEAGEVRGVRLYVERENSGAREVYTRLGMNKAAYEMYEIDFVVAR